MENSLLLKRTGENLLTPLNAPLDLFERCSSLPITWIVFSEQALRYPFIFTIVLRLLGSEDGGKEFDLQAFLEADS